MINYSIIIPHKNSPELLNRCLASIPQRNDIEIIVVDDNSDSAKKPQTSRIGVKIINIEKENSKGAGRARNVGLKEATGKWLLFADCDDYYINDCFSKLDKLKDTDYDIIFFDNDTNLNITGDAFHNRLEKMLKGDKRDKANFKHFSNTPWNKMYKRTFVYENDIQFDEIPIQNDAYFVHKASLLTDNFFYIDKKLYYYEINEKGITRRKRSKKDIEQLITTAIKLDKLRAKSGAWDCIYFQLNKQYINGYGNLFILKQQLRRIRHGLLWYIIRKKF